MHSASLSKSARLQRVHKVLKTGKRYSTMAIIKKAHVCAVNSIISELRANGIDISCQRKADKWFYQLA